MNKPLTLKYLKNEVITPVLKDLVLPSARATNLLLSTCAQESQFGLYRRQIGFDVDSDGGGFGIYQIELPTHHLVINWLLANKPYMLQRIRELYLGKDWKSANINDALINNDKYSTAIARVLYLSIAEPLPGENDIEGMANYWKNYYNRGGKGTVDQFIANYNKFVTKGK